MCLETRIYTWNGSIKEKKSIGALSSLLGESEWKIELIFTMLVKIEYQVPSLRDFV